MNLGSTTIFYTIVYQQVRQMLDRTLDQKVDDSTKEHITLLVLGIIHVYQWLDFISHPMRTDAHLRSPTLQEE
jgi:hypothetical protein